MKFQSGQAKLTFNSNDPTRPDSIKFKEIIEGDWNFILLSSYCTDYEWIMKEFHGISPDTEINLIEHYDRTKEHDGIQRITIPGSKPRIFNLIHPTFPKFPNYGVMHCKLIILAANDFLRIVISSANLMDFDYETVQNIVFIQDLPKLKENSLTASNASFLIDCQFYLALNRLLTKLGVFDVRKTIMPMDLMEKYDWKNVKAKLVYSIPDYSRIDAANSSGIAMLNNIVKDQFISDFESKHTTIEYQGSSVGAIKRDWLIEFGKSATGTLFEPSKSLDFVKKRVQSDMVADDKSSVIDLTADSDDEKDGEDGIEFKLVFPTLRTVKNSLEGPEAFGTLFCKKKDYTSESCPTGIFHDCTTASSSDGKCKYAMHSKIMTVSFGTKITYIYCGSHNFTTSAWGKTTKQGSMLMVNNYEVGVLIPASEWNCQYPYFRPPQKYFGDDLPWDQNDYYQLQ